MSRSNSEQLNLDDYAMQVRMTSGHGGPRRGAGAKRSGRGGGRYRRRTRFNALSPAHVTLRVVKGFSSLRRKSLVKEVRRTFAEGCERGDFRLVEYSIQHNHVHLIVEAECQDALSRGMKSISARFARAVNRVFSRRGRVIEGRYHLELLTCPTQVRNALRYVLLNIRKHFKQEHGKAPPVEIDPASSGSRFDGWKSCPEVMTKPAGERKEVGVANGASWLLTSGWRRLGLINPLAIPG
jgi:putative transposase